MKCELPGRTAFTRDNEDVGISVAVRRKSDPFPVGREARIDVSRLVCSNSLDVLAVFVGSPDICQISESYPAMIIVRVAGELDLTSCRRERRTQCREENEGIQSFHTSPFE